jgi:hypothetical protein
MASHPTENMFILVDMDGTITGYDIERRNELFKKYAFICLYYMVIYGSREGTIFIKFI